MSVDELAQTPVDDLQVRPAPYDADDRTITAARLRGSVAWWCVTAAALAAVGYAVGTVVAGRLAGGPPRWWAGRAAGAVRRRRRDPRHRRPRRLDRRGRPGGGPAARRP